jgi:DNA-binding transcriptional LysR family regulator
MGLSRHFFGELQAPIMDQLAEMRVFVRAIERGTFAVAASDLGLTPSAVSKLIGRLEARLGVRLINRTTRKLALTAEGETYFHSGRRLIEAVDGLEQEVAASAAHPRGLLRINTAVAFGVQHLAPALMEFNRRYPDVRVSMFLTDRPVDLHAEQIDVAVRMGPLNDSTLMSHEIAEIERVICASPAYIEEFGAPETPADLARHRCVVFTAPGRGRWPFNAADGGIELIEVPATFGSDSLECILQLALQGAGIARLADFMAVRPIRAGKLVPLLVEQHYPERRPAIAVFAPGAQKIPRVRVFLDFLIERFGRQSWQLDTRVDRHRRTVGGEADGTS